MRKISMSAILRLFKRKPQVNIIAADGGVINIGLMNAAQILTDQLMVLEQVKNDAKKQGDRGIIEAISEKPVKLIFASEEAKRAVLSVEENPFKCLLLVDVEVKSHEGRPKIYKIYTVKEIIRD